MTELANLILSTKLQVTADMNLKKAASTAFNTKIITKQKQLFDLLINVSSTSNVDKIEKSYQCFKEFRPFCQSRWYGSKTKLVKNFCPAKTPLVLNGRKWVILNQCVFPARKFKRYGGAHEPIFLRIHDRLVSTDEVAVSYQIDTGANTTSIHEELRGQAGL